MSPLFIVLPIRMLFALISFIREAMIPTEKELSDDELLAMYNRVHAKLIKEDPSLAQALSTVPRSALPAILPSLDSKKMNPAAVELAHHYGDRVIRAQSPKKRTKAK